MNRSVYVLGAGGHAKVVVQLLQSLGYLVRAIFDDDTDIVGNALLKIPILGPISSIAQREPLPTVIAIGNNQSRRRVAEQFECEWLSAVHPSAHVDSEVKIGRGTVVFAGAMVQPGTRLGDHVILNTGATVDHDCTIGDYAHVAPGAHIAGNVTIGDGSMFGIGATVVPGVRIGKDTIVGAGAAVVSNIPDGVVAVGVPASIRTP